jgi:AcrR family transcriptional regulator
MTARPLRADAAQNRCAIVQAAKQVFAIKGANAPLEDVAREANVGIATLYRRFPTRDDLLEAVFADKMALYCQRTADAAELARTRPWDALSDYVLFILEAQAEDPAFTEVLIAPLKGSKLFATERRDYLRSSVKLVSRAKAGRAVRADFDHSDLYLALVANSGLIRTAPEAWRRLGAYLLEGFKAPGAGALPPAPKSWRRSTSA